VVKYLIRLYMYSQYYIQKILKRGAFGEKRAIYINEKYQPVGNVVKDGLFKYHVKQFHESSCSVASVVSVVNSLLAKNGQMNGYPLTQQELLEHVKAAHWKERMGKDGYKGRRGLPLLVLGEVVEASLNTYQIPYQSVEIVHAKRGKKESKEIKDKLRSRLKRFETIGECLIITHFDQGEFIPEFHIPHISPVGGYNIENDMITMLDVDPEQIAPYEISFETYYKGISSNYNKLLSAFGYNEGGYIFIQL
jgi:hypothetical protein